MTLNEFEALVKKHEESASKNSSAYRFKVLLFTGLGFGYVLFFLALFLFLMGVSISMFADGHFSFGNFKLLLLTGALSFIIIKAMWIKEEMPEGYFLQDHDAVSLRAMIEELRAKLNTPPIHAIILNQEYNAAVTQIQKYGFAGRKKNVLMIGLPLLSTLSLEQFKAVLAHELAHISHSDTAFGAKIYRLRMTWARLLHSLEENEQFGTFIFRKFFQWYYPRYDAYTFALARQQEYDADMASAWVTSPETTRDALCTIPLGAVYYYHDFYNELFSDSSKNDVVPKPYSNFIESFKNLDNKRKQQYLSKELKQISYFTDTHPCLKDRLEFIKMEPVIPTNTVVSALDDLFEEPVKILQQFDQMWIEANQDNWKEDIKEYNESRVRFEEISSKKAESLDEMFEKANLTREFKGNEEAAVIYEEIISSYPADEETAPAYLNLAEIYLLEDQTSDKSIPLIRKAMEFDWECRLPGLNMLCEYYFQKENRPEFEEARSDLKNWENLLAESDEECEFFHPADLLVSPDKDEKEMNKGIEQIKNQHIITEAYLVKKVVTVIPERKQYLLGLKVIMPNGQNEVEFEEKLYEKFINELNTFKHTSIIILNGKDELAASIKKVENSHIFSRQKKEQAS